MITLIALVSGALVATGLPAQITSPIGTAVCQVTGGDCEAVRAAATGGDGPAGSAGQGGSARQVALQRPGAPAGSEGGAAGKSGDDEYWSCGWFGITACDMVQGFGKGVKQSAVEAVESTCLIHFCSHSGFKNTWKNGWEGVKGLYDDPGGSIVSMADDSTKEIREDWKNGHKASAMVRAIPGLIGSALGGKGLSKLIKLGKLRKAAKAGPNSATEASNAAIEATKDVWAAEHRGDIKAAEAALKQAERHLAAAEAAARKYPTGENLEARELAHDYVGKARKTLPDTKIRMIMMKSEIGRQAQKILNSSGVSVVYRRGGGTFYNAETNPLRPGHTIYVDTNLPEEWRAVGLIHETLAHIEGRRLSGSANQRAREMSRADFIDSMLREEVKGKVLEIEAVKELRAQGVKVAPLNERWEKIYKKAYDRAVESAAGDRSDLEKADLGKRAATEAILDEYRAGRATLSGSQRPYVESYGAGWDQLRKGDAQPPER